MQTSSAAHRASRTGQHAQVDGQAFTVACRSIFTQIRAAARIAFTDAAVPNGVLGTTCSQAHIKSVKVPCVQCPSNSRIRRPLAEQVFLPARSSAMHRQLHRERPGDHRCNNDAQKSDCRFEVALTLHTCGQQRSQAHRSRRACTALALAACVTSSLAVMVHTQTRNVNGAIGSGLRCASITTGDLALLQSLVHKRRTACRIAEPVHAHTQACIASFTVYVLCLYASHG